MRTDDEVTAAAERTADLALKCARLTRERDEALAAVERVRARIIERRDQIGARVERDPTAAATAMTWMDALDEAVTIASAALGERP